MRECTECGRGLPDLAVACPKCWTPATPESTQNIDPRPDADHRQSSGTPTPRETSRVISFAFKLYRSNVASFITPVALVVVPAQILGALIRAVGPDETDVLRKAPRLSPFVPPPIDGPPAVDIPSLAVLLVGMLATVGLGFIAIQLATAMSFKAVSDANSGNSPSWTGSLSFAFGRLAPLAWLAVVPTVMIGLGSAVGVIPGIWFFVSWAVAVPVLLAEGEHGGSALRRSVSLVRGRWWSVFGVLLQAWFIAAVSGLVIKSVLVLLGSLVGDGALAAFVTDALASAAAGALIAPFLAVTIAVLYFDLRAREEGLQRAAAAARKQKAGKARQRPAVRKGGSRATRGPSEK